MNWIVILPINFLFLFMDENGKIQTKKTLENEIKKKFKPKSDYRFYQSCLQGSVFDRILNTFENHPQIAKQAVNLSISSLEWMTISMLFYRFNIHGTFQYKPTFKN